MVQNRVQGARVKNAGVVGGAGFGECCLVQVNVLFVGWGVYSESSFLR